MSNATKKHQVTTTQLSKPDVSVAEMQWFAHSNSARWGASLKKQTLRLDTPPDFTRELTKHSSQARGTCTPCVAKQLAVPNEFQCPQRNPPASPKGPTVEPTRQFSSNRCLIASTPREEQTCAPGGQAKPAPPADRPVDPGKSYQIAGAPVKGGKKPRFKIRSLEFDLSIPDPAAEPQDTEE